MTRIKINADSQETKDFRYMVGDDHFERALVDTATNHIDTAFQKVFGQNLLKIQFTSRGHSVWSPFWLEANKRNLATIMEQELVRIVGIRPVIDLPLDFDEAIDLEQDQKVGDLSGFMTLCEASKSIPPAIKIKRMKKWKRLTVSFLEVYVPADIFPWRDIDPRSCSCPKCALIPQQGIIPSFYCGICGDGFWCSCMSCAVEKLLVRTNYDRGPIQKLIETAEQRDGVCHLCRGVPVTSLSTNQEGEISSLMSRYHEYRHVAAIEHDGDWRAGENALRERLGIPKIGEGWIGEALLLNRIISLFPDEEIIHQGSPSWLGRQRFDVWIPRLKVAVEYNGEQHYAPVSQFGGDAGFQATRMRDAKKRQLCAENGVRMVEIAYNEALTDDQLLDLING
ncbi:hypothetical protein FTO60_12530 [Octadecabacter sp. SW4]|uniref:hypothetical protein n=1 Tax=Octadecabacter sp. SW4 TaxID=2602067 RepID=UPI0011C20107|nr:hypothetical protein [Octadecabacter sp. SW4]QEE36465.1 hypothetical protein FTO60_12530 [Octadecabacter sp. SW4]